MHETSDRDARRLESLWAGRFGDEYVARNAVTDDKRHAFWESIVALAPAKAVLEVGCGQGGNLSPLCQILPPDRVWGIDVNREALSRAGQNAPGVHLVVGSALALPFQDASFDLVFTIGVLIHQSESTLGQVMREIVRCSGRYVLWGEYHADEDVEIPYHGEEGVLFKRDFGAIYHRLFPSLEIRASGFLGPEDGFDDVTWQLLEMPAAGPR